MRHYEPIRDDYPPHEREPLYILSDEQLEDIADTGNEQERHGARMILTNRAMQRSNGAAFAIPVSHRKERRQ